MIKTYYNFESNDGRIDDAEGIVYGVSLITMGNARGHNLEVDEKTLNQLKLSCEQAPKPGIKAKLNHRSGIEAVFGYINNFNVVDNKLTGDLHMLKSHKDYNQTMEQIQTLPGQIGLSVAFQGDKEPGPGGKVYARCKRIVSVDLVSDPAANPNGMFEEKVDKGTQNMDIEEKLQSILDGQQTLNDRIDGIEEFNQNMTDLITFNQEQLEQEYDDLDDDDYEDYEDDEYEYYDDEGDELEDVEYSAIDEILTHLENKAANAILEEEEARTDHAFDVIEDKVDHLAYINEELQLENEALREAIEMDAFEPLDPTGEEHLFGANADEGTFEFAIQAATHDAETPHEAIRTAVTNNPIAHTEWLRRQGILN